MLLFLPTLTLLLQLVIYLLADKLRVRFVKLGVMIAFALLYLFLPLSMIIPPPEPTDMPVCGMPWFVMWVFFRMGFVGLTVGLHLGYALFQFLKRQNAEQKSGSLQQGF